MTVGKGICSFCSQLFWEQKLQNLAHRRFLCFSFSGKIFGYFKQTLKSDWLFCFSVPLWLAEEKLQFRAKNSFGIKNHHAKISEINKNKKYTYFDKVKLLFGLCVTNYQQLALSILRWIICLFYFSILRLFVTSFVPALTPIFPFSYIYKLIYI